MDRATAVRIWREVSAGTPDGMTTGRTLEAFAARIEAGEREACKAVTRSLNIGPQDAVKWEVARTIERLIQGRSNVKSEGAEPLLAKLPLD